MAGNPFHRGHGKGGGQFTSKGESGAGGGASGGGRGGRGGGSGKVAANTWTSKRLDKEFPSKTLGLRSDVSAGVSAYVFSDDQSKESLGAVQKIIDLSPGLTRPMVSYRGMRVEQAFIDKLAQSKQFTLNKPSSFTDDHNTAASFTQTWKRDYAAGLVPVVMQMTLHPGTKVAFLQFGLLGVGNEHVVGKGTKFTIDEVKKVGRVWVISGSAGEKRGGSHELRRATKDEKRSSGGTFTLDEFAKHLKEKAGEIAKEAGYDGKIQIMSGKQKTQGVFFSGETLGEYMPKSETTRLYPKSIVFLRPKQQEGTIAHEFQHHKFDTVMKHYLSNGKFRAIARKTLDPYVQPTGKHFEKLARSGSKVSQYASDFWATATLSDAFLFGRKGDAQRQNKANGLAINETLAEVASMQRQGKYAKVPPIWKELYGKVDMLYRKIKRS